MIRMRSAFRSRRPRRTTCGSVGGPGEVIHWDGMNWSRLGVVGAANPRVAASPRAVYISGVSNPVLLR